MSQLKLTAEIGSLVALAVLGVSLSLPVLMGPGVSWEEAAYGYIPAGIAFLGFRIAALVAAQKSAHAEGAESRSPSSPGKSLGNVVAVGAVFDPNLHDALQQIDSPDHPPGVVVMEYEKGYMRGEKLLRAARVIVAGPGSTGAPARAGETPN